MGAATRRSVSGSTLVVLTLFLGLEVTFVAQSKRWMRGALRAGNSQTIARAASSTEDLVDDSETAQSFYDRVRFIHAQSLMACLWSAIQGHREASEAKPPPLVVPLFDIGLEKPVLTGIKNATTVELTLLPVSFKFGGPAATCKELGIFGTLPRELKKDWNAGDASLVRRVPGMADGSWGPNPHGFIADSIANTIVELETKEDVRRVCLVVEDNNLWKPLQDARSRQRSAMEFLAVQASNPAFPEAISGCDVILYAQKDVQSSDCRNPDDLLPSLSFVRWFEQFDRLFDHQKQTVILVRPVWLPRSTESNRLREKFLAKVALGLVHKLRRTPSDYMNQVETLAADGYSLVRSTIPAFADSVTAKRRAWLEGTLQLVNDNDWRLQLWLLAETPPHSLSDMDKALQHYKGFVPAGDVPKWRGVSAGFRAVPELENLTGAVGALAKAPNSPQVLTSLDEAVLSALEIARVFTEAHLKNVEEGANEISALRAVGKLAGAIAQALRSAKSLTPGLAGQRPREGMLEEMRNNLEKVDNLDRECSFYPLARDARDHVGKLLKRCQLAFLNALLDEAVSSGERDKINSALQAAQERFSDVEVDESRLAAAREVLKQHERDEMLLRAGMLEEQLFEECINLVELEQPSMESLGRIQELLEEARQLPPDSVDGDIMAEARARLQQTKDALEDAAQKKEACWKTTEAALQDLPVPNVLLTLPNLRELLQQVVINEQCETIQEKKLRKALDKAREKQPNEYLHFVALLSQAAKDA